MPGRCRGTALPLRLRRRLGAQDHGRKGSAGRYLPVSLVPRWRQRVPSRRCRGGPYGYDAFVEGIADSTHPEHEHMLDWHGGRFDPTAIDHDLIQARLQRIELWASR
ncbi:plasmid pRiA4b ORF-3 family protein [Burkholderia sp. AU30280]|uniref:plasmid pRiA4b ORF-3 family protein n=1 Tax=Burkholderia sp. AU30280 TaxID=2879628 RepID=UPI0021F429D6|nr:plasmid pRiA4b ORF-3 family protein [Burkholderia sp. AU30280]